MYIMGCKRSYSRDGQQRCGRAPFLILMSTESRPCGPDNVRGIVRSVALSQCGHWMMGSAQIGAKRITLSGSYGEDGLTCTVDEETFLKGEPLPPELYQAWNKGGGWNECGSEAEAMAAWARETFKPRGWKEWNLRHAVNPRRR